MSDWTGDRLADRYVDLLIRHLTGYRLDNCAGHPDEARENGTDWPDRALSMIGVKRMRNLADLVRRVVAEDVPGDLMECGVWRGGACILMRALLDVYCETGGRTVWAADSFAGLPPPDPARYPDDAGDTLHNYSTLAVGRAQVEANFAAEGWLDGRVRFVEGFFKASLPGPVRQLALLRLDGDMYGSILVCLERLYPLLSPGGIVIVDDYFQAPPQHAVHDYFVRERVDGIHIELTADGNAGWWVKP